ncbi:hypothetical protein Trydic_g21099 [Trypoxylus dichotomus]
MDLNESLSEQENLTEGQQYRIRKERERALMIRRSRLTVHPYNNTDVVSIDKSTIKIGSARFRDTGGGFLVEEEPERVEEPIPIVVEQPPIIEADRPICVICNGAFAKSWLFDMFAEKVCDNCKDPETHKLITKTEATNTYLLRDWDFDIREPTLKFISKKNPHNIRWGDMKLYLKLQVEKRALEVWGSMEKITEELERREERRVLGKTRRYNRQMRELRMNVRSSLYDRTSTSSHVHQFGEEVYNEQEDNYTHECTTCGYDETFEKIIKWIPAKICCQIIMQINRMCKKASRRCHVAEFRGCTVAIDTYCWLHKGAFGCAEKLVRGEDTNGYVYYCLKYIKMLKSYDIHPILVFDGQHLPAKKHTEEKRREQRKLSRKKASELLRLGKVDEARIQMKCAIDITHKMALALIKECRKNGVDCIVAPYEADAQLAYLNIKKFAHFVITEDSDLLLFGCNKIFFKMDIQGFGTLVEAEKINDCMKLRPDNYNFDKFRYMCILSGCDYLQSLPGVGIKKALKFISLTADPSIYNVLLKLPSYLKLPNIVVTNEYREGFMIADATFKHQLIFDPAKRKLLPLRDPQTSGTKEEYCRNAGHLFDETLAFEMALGNIDPFTHERYDDWSPDLITLPNTSIWSRQYHKPSIPIKKMPKLNAPSTKNMQVDLKAFEEEKVLYDQKLEKELEMYKVIEHVPKKQKTEEEFEPSSPQQKIKIPFKKLEKLSKFERTVVNYEEVLTSKFFAPKKSESVEEPSVSNYDSLLNGISSYANNKTIRSQSLNEKYHYKLEVENIEEIKETPLDSEKYRVTNRFGKFDISKKTSLKRSEIQVEEEEIESTDAEVILEEVENDQNVNNTLDVEDVPNYKTEEDEANLADEVTDIVEDIQAGTSRKRENCVESDTMDWEESNTDQQEGGSNVVGDETIDLSKETEKIAVTNSKSPIISTAKKPYNRRLMMTRKKMSGKNQMNLLTMFNNMRKS